MHFTKLFNYDRSKCKIDLPIEVDCEKDIGALLLSSGSTGRPKPIILTHCSIINLTAQIQHEELYRLRETTIHSCQNTFCHIGGLHFMCHTLACGAKAAIMPGFQNEKFLFYIDKYKVKQER